MNASLFPRFLIATLAILLAVLPLRFSFSQPKDQPNEDAENLDDACSKLRNFGKFYDKPESGGLQNAKFFFSYMHQFGYVDGKDKNGLVFDDSMEEIRRFWMGLQGKFADYWKFKAVSQLSNDRHNYPGDYRQWGHETFRSANLTFDAGSFWEVSSVDALEIGYGRRSARMADEWQRSAYLTNALERSDFSNKLWLSDEENGNPLAAWIKWKQGRHTFDTAVFSGTYDDYVGGWKDSKTYYASWLGDFSEGSGFDKKEFWLSFYSQDSTTSEDRLAKGNDYAFALVNRLAQGPWAFHTSIGFGNNGPQSDPDLEGDFGGIVAMPMYWIQENRLKLVLRYQYEGSDNPKGIRLNSRYARLAEARDSSVDVNSGRGDDHHSLYAGLNYYFCGENLKLISGIQHDDLSSAGKTQYQGWTLGTSLRIWF